MQGQVQRARDGGFQGQVAHTFNVGQGSSITIKVDGHLSARDAQRLHKFAGRLRALASGRVMTAGEHEDETAGWLDEAATYAGMAKNLLNTPVGKAAAAVVPYGGIIKSAAEGAADGLSMLQKSGVAKDAKTAKLLAQLHHPQMAEQAERQVRKIKEQAKSDPKARALLKGLQHAMYRHKCQELAEARQENQQLRQWLWEHGDARAFDMSTSGTEETAGATLAALHLFTDQALARARTRPQPTFRGLKLRHGAAGRH